MEISPVLHAQISDSCARAEMYILSRRCAGGGFCFYRYGAVDEPNVRDTFHALVALGLLGTTLPHREELIEFLTRVRLWGPTYVYDYAFSLELLGASDRISEDILATIRALSIEVPTDHHGIDLSAWLDLTYKVIRLQRRFVQPADAAQRRERIAGVLARVQRDGGFGVTANLCDTYRAARILALLDWPVDPAPIRTFVQSLEQPPFGFAVTEGSLSPKLDVAFAGVMCCELLRMPVRFPIDVLQFALACQTTSGGFGNAPVALANLEATSQGLGVITSPAANSVSLSLSRPEIGHPRRRATTPPNAPGGDSDKG